MASRWCQSAAISAVFNEQIYRVGGIPVWSFGECLIGYDEPFLRLHRLGEEACLWCAEITELRGLTSYALTHIKQALWFFSPFSPTVICFLFCLALPPRAVRQTRLSASYPQTWLVVLTEKAFLPHYQMLNQYTGGHHQFPSTQHHLCWQRSAVTYIDGRGKDVASVNLLPELWGIIAIHDLFSVC